MHVVAAAEVVLRVGGLALRLEGQLRLGLVGVGCLGLVQRKRELRLVLGRLMAVGRVWVAANGLIVVA